MPWCIASATSTWPSPWNTRLDRMVRDTTATPNKLHRRSNPELTNYATWLGLTG